MRKTMILAAVVILVASAAVAQETLEAKKWDSLEWYELTHIKFKPGEMQQAMKIVEKYFVPASQEAGGGPAMAFMHHSGEWDMTLVWKMKGLADMEWQISPSDVAWMNALAKKAGGMDKAMSIWAEYEGHVAHVERVIARGWEPVPSEK